MKGKIIKGNVYARNPHVRFDEGGSARAATPSRGSLLYKRMFMLMVGVGMVATAFAENGQSNTSQDAKPVVRLSVAFMAIGDQDVQAIGNLPPDDAFQPKVVSNKLYGLIHGSDTRSNKALVGASLVDTKRFFTQSGITRMSETDSAFIECGSKKSLKFKRGGTFYVKSGEKFREMPYGVEIDAKGDMAGEDMLNLDFELCLSTIIPTDDETYDLKEDRSKQKINCPIGRTTLVSSFVGLVDRRTPPSRLPLLRSMPLLNWFVADSGKEVSDRRLVVMICPEIVDDKQNVVPDDNKAINIPMPKSNELDGGHECEACKKCGGFCPWLVVLSVAVVAAFVAGYVVSSRRRASSMR